MPNTKIEWATKAWNIVEGCTKVSTGCKHCYAERLAKRMRRDFSKVELQPERLDQPRHWRDSQVVFVCSRSDPFHPEVPSEFLARAFEVMRETPQHRYLMLTKRPELAYTTWNWPDNVYLGVSAEDQPNADCRLTELMQVARMNQIAHLFVSAEPLLGPLVLTPWLWPPPTISGRFRCDGSFRMGRPIISWVIVGGETGPGARLLVERVQVRCHDCCDDPGGIRGGVLLAENAAGTVAMAACKTCRGEGSIMGWMPKPEALGWVRDIRDQCQAAGVPFDLKQWGGPSPKSGGRMLDGRVWDERPLRGGE